MLGAALGKSAESVKPVSDIVLQLLRLLATPLIFFSLLHSVLTANVHRRMAGRLLWILLSNSTLAILISLGVANVLEPGRHVHLRPPAAEVSQKPFDLVADLVDRLPKDFLNPFANNDLIAVIVVGLAFAIALRSLKSAGRHVPQIDGLVGYVELGREVTLKLLHWVFELIPLAVLAVVADIVGTQGLGRLIEMGWFVAAVLIALLLMCGVYAVRLRLSSWVRPADFLRGGADAFVLAFSSASSAATLPVTYECAVKKIGVREESASLGVMVGGTFNHDGGASYEAMAALFICQAIGRHFSFEQQLVVVLMALVASVGAAGIPQAGLVTMIAVFNATHLPIDYIPLLLPLDWFLDRCRTTINVAGDLVSTCILDGRQRSVLK